MGKRRKTRFTVNLPELTGRAGKNLSIKEFLSAGRQERTNELSLNHFFFRSPCCILVIIIKERGCFAKKFIWENWTLIYAVEHGWQRQKKKDLHLTTSHESSDRKEN